MSLVVRNLAIEVAGRRVVDGLDLDVPDGARVGLIGESGSGKSLTALAVLGLLPDGARATGSIRWDDRELVGLRDRDLARLRGDEIGMVFQEPQTALNPIRTVGRQIAESIRIHERDVSRREAWARAVDEARRVRLPDPEQIVRRYPHQLSGGQRQRVAIAMALACRPRLLIADEPTTALDVTIQAEILDLLQSLVDADGMSLVFITHDLAVLSQVATEALVLEAGRAVERGPLTTLLRDPASEVTRGLLRDATATLWEAGRPGMTEIIRGRGLTRRFRTPRIRPFQPPRWTTALEDADVDVREHAALGIIGESGSGKSTLVRLLLGLDAPTAGTVAFDGRPVDATASARSLHWLRRRTGVVFQDPYASLDPRMSVGRIVAEPLTALGIAGDHRARVREVLDDVGLPADAAERFPHEFSGGQRQRIALARALVHRPDVLVGDEPLSALDVTVRAQILELIRGLRARDGLTLVMVSHDIGVVQNLCDDVIVMTDGRIVEEGPTEKVLLEPQVAYTRRLLASIPIIDPRR